MGSNLLISIMKLLSLLDGKNVIDKPFPIVLQSWLWLEAAYKEIGIAMGWNEIPVCYSSIESIDDIGAVADESEPIEHKMIVGEIASIVIAVITFHAPSAMPRLMQQIILVESVPNVMQ